MHFSFSVSPENSQLQGDVSSGQNDTSRRVSCFGQTPSAGRPDVAQHDTVSKLCDDIGSRIKTRVKQQRDFLEHYKLEHSILYRLVEHIHQASGKLCK